MTRTFLLRDADALADLRTFLSRAGRLGASEIRLAAQNGVLAVTVPVLTPQGILDQGPLVVGMRTFAEESAAHFDITIDPRSLTERLARPLMAEETGAIMIPLPDATVAAAWSGMAPPRAAWEEVGVYDAAELRASAESGIRAVQAALPEDPGEAIVRTVRRGIWSEALDELGTVPRGAAFAAETLGFLGDDPVRLLRTGSWSRLTSTRGHVLIRGRAAAR